MSSALARALAVAAAAAHLLAAAAAAVRQTQEAEGVAARRAALLAPAALGAGVGALSARVPEAAICLPSDDDAERRVSFSPLPSLDTRGEWTLEQIGKWAPYPTSDARCCEVTASGLESAHFPADRLNALRVAELRHDCAGRFGTLPPNGGPQCAQCALSPDVRDDATPVQVARHDFDHHDVDAAAPGKGRAATT